MFYSFIHFKKNWKIYKSVLIIKSAQFASQVFQCLYFAYSLLFLWQLDRQKKKRKSKKRCWSRREGRDEKIDLFLLWVSMSFWLYSRNTVDHVVQKSKMGRIFSREILCIVLSVLFPCSFVSWKNNMKSFEYFRETWLPEKNCLTKQTEDRVVKDLTI